MTCAQVIDEILAREGGYVDHPADVGGPTHYGITAATLGAWRKLGRPATAAEVHALARDEAIAICGACYIDQPGFSRIGYAPLRAQLIDFGYHSSPARAVRWLQRVLGVSATGHLDSGTLTELDTQNLRIVNDALVAARLYMVERVTDADQSQKEFEEGWEGRALEFFQSRPIP